MSKKDKKLNLENREWRFGFYNIPERGLYQQESLVGGDPTVIPEGIHFLAGQGQAREMKVQTMDFPARKIDGENLLDFIVDFAIDYKIAGGKRFDDSDADKFLKSVDYEDKEKATDKELDKIDKKSKTEEEYNKKLDELIKSKNKKARRSFWKKHHPIHKYLESEESLKAEKNNSNSNIKGTMENVIMDFSRKYLSGLPMLVAKKIDDPNFITNFYAQRYLVDYLTKIEKDKLAKANEAAIAEGRVDDVKEFELTEELEEQLNQEAARIINIKDDNYGSEELKNTVESIYNRIKNEAVYDIYDKMKKELEDVLREKGIELVGLRLAKVEYTPEVNEMINAQKLAKEEQKVALTKAETEKQVKITEAEAKAAETEIIQSAKNKMDKERMDSMEGKDYKFILSSTSPENMNKVSEKNVSVNMSPTTEDITRSIIRHMEARKAANESVITSDKELFTNSEVKTEEPKATIEPSTPVKNELFDEPEVKPVEEPKATIEPQTVTTTTVDTIDLDENTNENTTPDVAEYEGTVIVDENVNETGGRQYKM